MEYLTQSRTTLMMADGMCMCWYWIYIKGIKRNSVKKINFIIKDGRFKSQLLCTSTRCVFGDGEI